jgi:hypothetical protein
MRRRSISSANTPHLLRPLMSGAVVWVGALAVAAFSLTFASAQPPSEASKATTPALPSAAAGPAAAAGPKAVPTTKPLWSELTAEQQQALKPLSVPHWNTLNIGPEDESGSPSRATTRPCRPMTRARLHSRMIEWAALEQSAAQPRPA